MVHAALISDRRRPDPVTTTMSIGVAACPADGNNATELFAAADKRLYAAKENGRGRIVLPLPG